MADQFRFGTIVFEGAACQTDQDTAKFVIVDSKCNVELLIETTKKQWNLCHPNLLISIMGGAWDFPVSNWVKEVFRSGLTKATKGTKAWILTSGTDVGAAKYCADSVFESRIVNEGMGIENTTSTIGIAAFNWLLSDVRNKLDAATNSSEPAIIVSPSSSDTEMLQTDRMLNPHHTHFILVEDNAMTSSHMNFSQGASAALHLRVMLEKEMSTYKTEATESDFADIMREVKPANLPDLFKGLGHHFDAVEPLPDWKQSHNNDTTFDALDMLRKWKTDDHKGATRQALIRALKKCNTEAKRNIEWQWRDGQVPVVCIYIEGGRGVLHHACEAVKFGIPIVVVDNSGRAASLLAMAFRSDGLKRDNDELKAKLAKIVGSSSSDEMFESIISCLKEKRSFWHVYSQESEIDQVILEAVMSAYMESSSRQLDLAQTWNRYDIITKEFFINMIEDLQWDDYNAEVRYFEERLHKALVNNQPGFVKLFLENGVINLQSYLTKKELQSLYDEVQDTPLDYFKDSLMYKRSEGLETVGRIVHLLSTLFHPYKGDNKTNDEKDGDNINEKFRNPFAHLFLFAVINNFHEMAEYFWEEGTEHMAAALIASAMYKSMTQKLVGDNDHLAAIALKYENLACDILSESTDSFDKDTVHNLLLRTLTNWDNTTCLGIAEASLCQHFLAHDSVQLMIGEIWHAGLPVHMDVMSKPSITDRLTRAEKVAPHGKQNGHAKARPQSAKASVDKGKGKPTRRRRRSPFSPSAKVFYYTMSEILHVMLYTYVVISNQLSASIPSWPEILLIVWTSTLIGEEIRQFAQEIRHGKWIEYISNYWNIIDIAMLTLFVLAIVLRFIPATQEAGRILLSVDLFLFCFRFLELLTLSRQLGPKVLMIFKMLVDLLFFMFILLVIIVGYGLSVMAVQYPRAVDFFEPWDYFRNIFYVPYFQIFGELFLEDILATPSDGTCTNNVTAIGLGATMCPHHSLIGLLLLAVFMLLSNVLLLNLLIAIFSDTFAKVQEETDVSWKYQFYSITKEYFQRPILTPPFIVIVNLYRSIRWLLRILEIMKWHPIKMQLEFFPARMEKLIKLEEAAAYNYITNKRRQQYNQNLCRCYHHTERSKKRILDRLNEIGEMPS
ncbi:transient receptor potential cation channel subfamily M member-like 2 [Amphiura filiformis]|uniref:transient receptor potential cation channel subfamily M member-like 2 n=1 Tax=Amphiura filiformis TaxID=82378 RepID=UPI003B22790F